MEIEQSELFDGSSLSFYEEDFCPSNPLQDVIDAPYVEDYPPELSDSEFERLLERSEVSQTDEKTGESTHSNDTASTAASDFASAQLPLFHDNSYLPSPEQTKRKLGRRVKVATLLLQNFVRSETETRVKKEYLRVELLRGFKRAIRFALEKRVPRKKIEGFKERDKKSAELWARFRKYVRKHRELDAVAQTESGPCTEAKTKRTPTSKGPEKTFNDRYCRQFFAASEVHSAYLLYLQVVFAHDDDSVLAAKFRFRPTSADQNERKLAWDRLREYLHHGMLQELGVARPE